MLGDDENTKDNETCPPYIYLNQRGPDTTESVLGDDENTKIMRLVHLLYLS